MITRCVFVSAALREVRMRQGTLADALARSWVKEMGILLYLFWLVETRSSELLGSHLVVKNLLILQKGKAA